MPAAFVRLDRDWRFRYLNAEAERLMGVRREELLGRSIWQAYPGLAGTRFEAAYREAVATGRPVPSKNGVLGSIAASSSPRTTRSRGSISAVRRALNARAGGRRSRVCAGGSRLTIDGCGR